MFNFNISLKRLYCITEMNSTDAIKKKLIINDNNNVYINENTTTESFNNHFLLRAAN